ncbi:MAG: hypothetical protein U0931_38840 [Vulcanimicrobiota bacterium]
MDKIGSGDALGAANVAKLTYQSSRAARGLGLTTRLTAALDLTLGATGVGTAGSAGGALMSGAAAANGATSIARLSQGARLVNFASKAAPVLGRATGALGLALGGFEVGHGVYNMTHGKKQEGRDEVVSGGLNLVTSGALSVAFGAGATGVGAPVAAVALGVAAGAQAIRLGYQHRHEIGQLAQRAGDALSAGYHRLENIFR